MAKPCQKSLIVIPHFLQELKKVMLPIFVLQASISLHPIVEMKAYLYDIKVFQKLAITAMSHTVDLTDIITYELGPVPLSLAKSNGNMNKTAKSKLMQELEVDSSVNDISTTATLQRVYLKLFLIPLDTQKLWLSAQINMMFKNPLNALKDSIKGKLSFITKNYHLISKSS